MTSPQTIQNQVKTSESFARRVRIGGRRHRVLASVTGFLVLAVVAAFAHGEPPAGQGAPARTAIHALAHLEPRSGLVTVGARPGARILQIAVEEGAVVKAGDPLATLEGNEQARQQHALAVAQKKRALERRTRAREKAKLERKQLDDTLSLQRSALASQAELTKKKNATAQALHAGLSAVGGLAKLPPKDQIEFESILYLLQIQTIKTGLELNELDAKKAVLGDQRKLEDEELADGGLEDELLDRQIDVAKAALDQTLVVAPSPGTILSVVAHPGEISAGPLLTIGDLSSIVARAEVDQSDVGGIRVGDVARAIVIDQAVTGKVTRIGSLVGFNQMRSIDPRAAQDNRVVQATILLDRPEQAARFIGMQVDVAIETGLGRPSNTPKAASP